MIDQYKIGFIGAGNMAEALCKGMLSAAGPLDIAVSDLNTIRLDVFATSMVWRVSVRIIKRLWSMPTL